MPTRSPPLLSHVWLLLAVASLGLAALAALALVFARTPILTAFVGPDAFARALVVHVNFATLIWYFAASCALWTERLPAARRHAAAGACVLGAGGALGVAISGMSAAGSPVLANYIPFVDSPFFLAALACFAVAGLATALLSLQRPRDAAEWGFVLARWPFLMAAVYLVLRLNGGASLVEAVWGAGHVLQFGFVTLLMAIWLRLVQCAGGAPLPTRWAIALFAAAALPATITPVLYVSGTLEGQALYDFHTTLMRWANWPAPLLFGLLLVFGRPLARRAAGFYASVGLLIAGCLAGFAIDSETTLVPAHYHGTIGAFTLALMAATRARLMPQGPGVAGMSRLPLTLYASGSGVLIVGLAWSGMLGAPRKSSFDAVDADLATTLSAVITGLGGVITVSAVVLFVIIAVSGVYRLCIAPSLRQRRNGRPYDAPMFAAAR